MLPRFANPHFLPQSTFTATRAELFAGELDDAPSIQQEKQAEIDALNRLIEQSLPAHERPATSESPVPRKKKKIATPIPDATTEEQADQLVLFRLVSSSRSPIPLSLLPPPPPPSKTREPDAEDTEERALLRKQRAEAASIDGAQVLRESQTLKASSHAPVALRASVGEPTPGMMILRTLQPPRKTRPPLSSLQTLRYPYTPDTSTLPSQRSTLTIPNCPTVDAAPPQPAEPRRRSRRRRKGEVKERPPPQFWRPSADMKGKCRGYAFGYPGSLPTEYLGTWSYRRDTMKKGKYVDNVG